MKKLVLAAVTLSLSACASIVSDSQYPVSIQSSPDGAKFRIKNEYGMVIHQGLTPSVITLEASDGFFSKAHYTVEFFKDKQTVVQTLNPSVDGWYFVNLLFGGIIGMLIIDPATGAMYKLPKFVQASLIQDDFSEMSSTVKIVSIESLDDAHKKLLIPINN